MKSKKGFSLAEMMAVIAVLGILVVLLIPNVIRHYTDSKKTTLIDEAKTIYTEASNKYMLEKTNGNIVEEVNDETDDKIVTYQLDLSGNDLVYQVKLDKETGEVTSIKVGNDNYCVEAAGGSGDLKKILENLTADDVKEEPCNKEERIEGEIFTVKLNADDIKDYPVQTNGELSQYQLVKTADPRKAYLSLGVGWYGDSKLTASIEALNEKPYIPNHVFMGFYDKPQSKSVSYDSGLYTDTAIELINYNGVFNTDSNALHAYDSERESTVIAYPHFRLNSTTVSYDSCFADAKGSMDSSTHYYGLPSALAKNGFTRKDFEFAGWSTTGCSGEIDYADGDDITVMPEIDGESQTLYAHWRCASASCGLTQCKPDKEDYCTEPVYYEFAGMRFVLYRLTGGGYKMILDGIMGPATYLQTRCCNYGNCFYTETNYSRTELSKLLNCSNMTSSTSTCYLNAINNYSGKVNGKATYNAKGGYNYKTRIIFSPWNTGYKGQETTQIESAYIGLLDYLEYYHTNANGYMFVYNGQNSIKYNFNTGISSEKAPNNVWWWTLTPTTNQPYYYDAAWYLANVILRYNSSTNKVEYSEKTVNSTNINVNHTGGNSSTIYYRPVILFKSDVKILSGDGTKENPYLMD